MSESVSANASSSQPVSARQTLLYNTWGIVLLTTVPEIILRGFMQMDTPWMLPVQIGLTVVLFVLASAWSLMRPLRRLVFVFLVLYVVEAWFFGTLLSESQLFLDVFGGNAHLAFFGERLLRIGACLVMLLVLLGMGLQRRDFFLAAGNLRATAEPEKWGVPRRVETWPGFSLRYAVIITVILLLFMLPGLQPSLSNLSVGLVLFAAVCAVLNAFAEEFLYRSALLPHLLPLFGKGMSLLLVAAWFGLAHFFGMPNGLTGVFLTGFAGWVFAKSMVETGGMGWAVFMHFVSDFVIYLVVLLAGGF